MNRTASMTLGMLVLLGIAGCGTIGGVQDDGAAIANAVAKWSEAIVAHDLDVLMQLYSEDYSDADGNSKSDLRDFLADFIDQGALDDLEVDTEDAVMTLDEGTATYNGILLTSAMGSATVDLTFGRESGGWKIVSQFAN